MRRIIFVWLLFAFKLVYIFGQTGQPDICPCDITGNSCDLNCCCDKECDANDKKVFSQCLDYSQSFDPKLCIQKNVIVFNNTDYPTEYTQNNLLCIYYDNYAARNFYTEPTVVDNLEKFREYANMYASDNNFSRTDYLRLGNVETLNDYYKVGDPVLTVSGDRPLSYFLLPRPGMTSFCTYNSAADEVKNELVILEFLINKNYQCVESVKDLSQKCTSAWHMNAQNFYANFSLLKNLKGAQKPKVPPVQQNGTHLFDKALYDVIDIQAIAIMTVEDNTTTTEMGSMPKPQWLITDNVCKSVPFKVEYEVSVSKENDINSAVAKIYLRNVFSTEQYFKREFSIIFKMLSNKENVSSEDTIVRSGNPGYTFGLPVMAGEAVFNDTREAILLSVFNNQWLTTVKSDSSGSCRNDSRQPVLFGINHETGCTIELSSNVTLNRCKQIRQEILTALSGPVRNRIGSFGNASIYNAKDWVPVLEENAPHGEAGSPSSEVCSNIVLGSDMEILYAYSGIALKPQARIIGAKIVYRAPQEIRFQCSSDNCRSRETRSTKYFVGSTVTFIDVTQPPVPAIAEIPTFDIKLPNDFFYPFSSGVMLQNFGWSWFILYIFCCVLLYRQ